MVTGDMADSPSGATFDATYADRIELLRSDPERYFREYRSGSQFARPDTRPRRRWWRPRRAFR